jgi:hypothetical protein
MYSSFSVPSLKEVRNEKLEVRNQSATIRRPMRGIRRD